MPTVSNKTAKPLSVPLPGGKTLHLGPGKTGQIAAKALENARFKKMVEAGEVEIISTDAQPPTGTSGDKRGRPAIDACSSAPWFTGWFSEPRAPDEPRPTLKPRTHLLRVGWQTHGFLHAGEAPRPH